MDFLFGLPAGGVIESIATSKRSLQDWIVYHELSFRQQSFKTLCLRLKLQ
jgi:hypothetical protein